MHTHIETIPSGATVKLEERMQGNLGNLSGQIVVDVAVYDKGEHLMSIEVNNTHKTDLASRPGRVIEVSAKHINELYDKRNGTVVVLLPIADELLHACAICQEQLHVYPKTTIKPESVFETSLIERWSDVRALCARFRRRNTSRDICHSYESYSA